MVRNTIGLGGAVVFWSLGEFSDREQLKQGFESLGRGALTPEVRTQAACLRDALADLFQERDGLLIRPLAKKNGFAVIAEERGEDTNSLTHVVTAKIEGDNAISLSPFNQDQAERLKTSYDRYMGMVRPAALAGSLIKAMGTLGGQRLRPGGGVYWLPGERVDEWSSICAVVEAAACNGTKSAIYRIEHDFNSESVRAVRDAVIEEVQAASARLKKEIMSGDLGERALETRQYQAEELRRKVELYESILNVGLESCRAVIEEAANAEAAAVILQSGL